MPTFRPTSAVLQGGARPRTFRLLPGKWVSLSTVDGRIRVAYRSGQFQEGYLADGWLAESARLVAKGRTLYLDVTLSKEGPAAPLEDRTSILGCDPGQTVLAAISGSDGSGQFFGGGRLKHTKRHDRRVRKAL